MKKTVDWKKFWKYFGCSILLLFLVVGVPVIINELYKLDCGYLTVWSGADVLGYYGTLLGSVAAIFILDRTVKFTRKQIKYDSYMQQEHEKWRYIEELVNNVLVLIQPEKLINLYMDTLTQLPQQYITRDFLLCGNNAYNTYITLICNLNEKDKDKLSQLPCELKRILFLFMKLASEFQKVIKEANNSEGANVGEIGIALMDQARELQKNEYPKLLELKNKSFDVIYQSIEKEAEKILK